MNPKQTVMLPIEVPVGDYCWKSSDACLCEHFDNEGGHPRCYYDLGWLKYDKIGSVRKPAACLSLTIKDVE